MILPEPVTPGADGNDQTPESASTGKSGRPGAGKLTGHHIHADQTHIIGKVIVTGELPGFIN